MFQYTLGVTLATFFKARYCGTGRRKKFIFRFEKKSPLSYLEYVLDGHCGRKLVSDKLHCDVFRGLRSCPFADILPIVAHINFYIGKVKRLQT
jgi:hypothetical protein